MEEGERIREREERRIGERRTKNRRERKRVLDREMKVLGGERRIEEIDVGLGGREKEKGRFGETDREKKVGEKQD